MGIKIVMRKKVTLSSSSFLFKIVFIVQQL